MLDKLAARELLREKVYAEFAPLIEAQIANALGISFLVVREKATGKFVRVAKGQAERLDPEHEIIEVWEKDPSIQAFTSLMDRAIDKPVEQVEMQVSGELAIVESRLRQGLRRAVEARAKLGEAA